MEFVSQFLLALPIWGAAAVLIGIGAFATASGILVVNGIWTPRELAENNNVGGFKFAFLGQVVSALLGFVLLEAGTTYIAAQNHVRNEVAALRQMGVIVGQMDRAVAAPLLKAEQHYMLAVVEREWPALSHGEESEAAGEALRDLYRVFLTAQPAEERDRALLQQAMPQLDKVVEMRTSRVGDASEDLAGLIWFAIVVAVGVSIIYTWFFGSNLLIPQVLMGMLLSTAIMALVTLAVVLGHPFAGELAISNKGYWLALRDLEGLLVGVR